MYNSIKAKQNSHAVRRCTSHTAFGVSMERVFGVTVIVSVLCPLNRSVLVDYKISEVSDTEWPCYSSSLSSLSQVWWLKKWFLFSRNYSKNLVLCPAYGYERLIYKCLCWLKMFWVSIGGSQFAHLNGSKNIHMPYVMKTGVTLITSAHTASPSDKYSTSMITLMQCIEGWFLLLQY